jgi:hypothetical protein
VLGTKVHNIAYSVTLCNTETQTQALGPERLSTEDNMGRGSKVRQRWQRGGVSGPKATEEQEVSRQLAEGKSQ